MGFSLIGSIIFLLLEPILLLGKCFTIQGILFFIFNLKFVGIFKSISSLKEK